MNGLFLPENEENFFVRNRENIIFYNDAIMEMFRSFFKEEKVLPMIRCNERNIIMNIIMEIYMSIWKHFNDTNHYLRIFSSELYLFRFINQAINENIDSISIEGEEEEGKTAIALIELIKIIIDKVHLTSLGDTEKTFTIPREIIDCLEENLYLDNTVRLLDFRITYRDRDEEDVDVYPELDFLRKKEKKRKNDRKWSRDLRKKGNSF